MSTTIRTLIVDDSAIIRAMLHQVLKDDPRFEVIGEAVNGKKALDLNEELKADLIIMDYNMPVMDGLEASKQIFETSANLPAIVIFTTETNENVKDDFLAVGVLAYFQKPNIANMNTSQLKKICDSLVDIYNKRRVEVFPNSQYLKNLEKNAYSQEDSNNTPQNTEDTDFCRESDYELVLIGSSTGGPEALKKLIFDLGPNFPLPIIVSQHIDSLFDKQMPQWLSTVTKVPVHLAKDGEIAKKGHVYLAPADKHLKVLKSTTNKNECILCLSTEPPVHFLRPAVDVMFKSAREVFGSKCIAVILTGMGQDGSEELLKLKEAGSYTICESEETCIVYGMPKAAIEIGAACDVLSLDKIGEKIKQILKTK